MPVCVSMDVAAGCVQLSAPVMIDEVPACLEKLEAKLQNYKELQHESSQKVRPTRIPRPDSASSLSNRTLLCIAFVVYICCAPAG